MNRGILTRTVLATLQNVSQLFVAQNLEQQLERCYRFIGSINSI